MDNPPSASIPAGDIVPAGDVFKVFDVKDYYRDICSTGAAELSVDEGQ